MRAKRLMLTAAGALLAAAIAGGIAYATIPDSGNVYTACMLNKVGTIRLIDPSLGNSSLMGHCVGPETQISWHQQGQKGDPGVPGQPGKDGMNGVSPTVAQLPPADSHCPAGGAAITDAAGTTAYVCSGQNGKDFSGAFTSPNGQFSLKVADTEVKIAGPGTSITLDRFGFLRTLATDETITTTHDLNLEALHDETNFASNVLKTTVDNLALFHSRHDRIEVVDHDQTDTIHGQRSETVDGALSLGATGNLSLAGSSVSINGATSCQPAARVGDQVSSALAIVTGSPTVCIGG